MKLLGWMHRKFRQGSGEPLKDFSSGNPPLDDDIQCYPKANHYFTKSSSKSQRDNHHLLLRKSFADSRRADHHGLYYDEEDLQRDSSAAALSDLFHGFLAIGTLGGGDPYATPTFSISVDNIAEKETGEVTESDLRMINDELEKVLLADGDQITSGRSSLVSNPRSSYCSTITLSGKQLESIEAAAAAAGATNICPLQGYLLGSAAIGASEATANKKEPRPSLGELFQKTKMVDENKGVSNNKKENDRSSTVHHLLKKILKKGMINHPSSKGSSTADSAADTKFNKVLQMFHRKVHPESMAAAAAEKLNEKPSNKQNQLMYDSLLAGNGGGGGEDVALVPKRRMSKDGGLRRLKSQSGLRRQLAAAASGDPNVMNKECWIKSDADYLVLEL